jgi:hypothetical protein
MKLKIPVTVFVFVAATTALIAFSQIKSERFAPAEDFPRGALVYAQINDLPAFIKLWNESKFMDKYLASENFGSFKNQHLGRKLASRWNEFNEASGFPIDLETVAGLTENRAAIAVYDIGKLEFVFIAPISAEVFAATKFFQNRNKFAEETLEGGATVYRAAVEADRGRQKQELIFAAVGGRFVLATSEKLLTQTLKNIKGGQAKSRLTDEPAFAALSEKIVPHVAAVWVNQTTLNDDYYFKRYWLMSDVAELENIRAGIFDFEIQADKLIERRKFLLDKPVEITPFENAQAAELLSFLPENISFYRLHSANPKTIDEAVENTIFERRKFNENQQKTNHQAYYSSFDDYNDYSGDDYENLNEKFEETITEIDEEETIENRETDIDFSSFLKSTAPRHILTFTEPEVLPAPLFVEFNRAAVFNLASPGEFNRQAFEAAIARNLAGQTMISAPGVKLNWESNSENDLPSRVLKLPAIGIEVCYAMRGKMLILANDEDFLRNILSQQTPVKTADYETPITALTVVNLERRESAYDLVFAELTKNKAADEFFTGNIESLLDSLSEVRKIEIRENYSRNLLEEELIINLK